MTYLLSQLGQQFLYQFFGIVLCRMGEQPGFPKKAGENQLLQLANDINDSILADLMLHLCLNNIGLTPIAFRNSFRKGTYVYLVRGYILFCLSHANSSSRSARKSISAAVL